MSGRSGRSSGGSVSRKSSGSGSAIGEGNEESNSGIDAALLEKRLESLRDTQESVQGLSIWCQAYKKHSTAIIDTWLRVLRKSPVEKRLTMFYLANDIVQHAKRKGDATVVNQWAVAVQKATPHVRTPSSISNAISRIFKIWEERGIYSKDAVADLLSLLSKHTVTGKDKGEKPSRKPETYTASSEKVSGFQPNSLISKAKHAFRLKNHLGVTYRTKHYVNMNMDQLIGSIKSRQHGMEVISDMTSLLDQCRTSETKLLNEVEERRKIVETAEIGIVYYENVRSEARIVNTAYKNFTERVVSTKEKVDEKMRAFNEMENMGSPPSSPPRNDSMSMSMRTQIQHQHSQNQNTRPNFIPLDVIQGLDMEALQSIKLPKQSPAISNEVHLERPPDDVPWTNTSHSNSTAVQAIKSLVSPTTESGYTSAMSVSSMAGISDSNLQHLAQAQLQAETPTGWSQWSNEGYRLPSSNTMPSMPNLLQMQQQYHTSQPPPQQQHHQQPLMAPITARSGQNFTLTPSMQLQMQLQQQHAMQYGGFPPSVNVMPVPAQPGDVSSIPLPPGPNPPLPEEPVQKNQNQNHGTAFSRYGGGNPNQFPQDWANQNQKVPGTGEQQESYEKYEPQGLSVNTLQYTPQTHRYHPYNQNQSPTGGSEPGPRGRGGSRGGSVGWSKPSNQPPVIRSPAPGYSPRNPLMGANAIPLRGGPVTPTSGYNMKAGDGGMGSMKPLMTVESSGLSPDTGTAISPEYGYTVKSYSTLESDSEGVNGNEDGCASRSTSSYKQFQTSPFENKFAGFSPQKGGRILQPMYRGRGFSGASGRGFNDRGRGGGGFRGRGMRGGRRGF